MRPESPKLLEDARAAAGYILTKTRGLTLDEDLADDAAAAAVRYFCGALFPG